MTKYMYSNGSFYPYALREQYEAAGTWPENGEDVDEDVFTDFTGTPPQGKTRGTDKKGKPTWINLPEPSDEDLLFQNTEMRNSLRAKADVEISWRQDAVDAEIATDEEATKLAAWKKYRVLLMRVDVSSKKIKWPQSPEQ